MGVFYVPARRLTYYSLGKANNLFFPRSPNLFILCYHSISNGKWDFSVSQRDFKEQINYLQKYFQFIRLTDLELYLTSRRNPKKPSVILTFDDGYRDILSIKRFLKEKSIQPTVFLIANGKKANRRELETSNKFLTKRDILSLIKDGWEIGCHSYSHPNFTELTTSQIEKEVIFSKSYIEKILRIKVNYFAYPKGNWNKEIVETVDKARYKLAFSMEDEFISKRTYKYLIPRIGVDGTHSFSEFKTLFNPTTIIFRGLVKFIQSRKSKANVKNWQKLAISLNLNNNS